MIGVELPSCCLLDVKKWFNSLFSGLVLYIVFFTQNIAFPAVGVVALLLAGVRQTRKNFILLHIECTLAHLKSKVKRGAPRNDISLFKMPHLFAKSGGGMQT